MIKIQRCDDGGEASERGQQDQPGLLRRQHQRFLPLAEKSYTADGGVVGF